MFRKIGLAGLLGVALALALPARNAAAACAATLTVKDGNNTSQTVCTTLDTGTNNVYSFGILGGTSNANKLSITSNSAALVEGVGTAGTATGGVVTVQGVASMTPLLSSQSGTWTVQPGNTPNTSAWLVQPVPGSSNGATSFTLNSAATTNSTSIKGSAGTLYHVDVQNKATAAEFLLFFNSASAPTCTGTPVFTFQVPAVTSTGNAVGGIVVDYGVGVAFSSGIGICATTAIGGTGAVALNDLTINVTYK